MTQPIRYYYECTCGSAWSMVFETGDRQARTRQYFRCRTMCRPTRSYKIPEGT